MDDYEDEDDDSTWDDTDWPEDWDVLADEHGWEVFDIDISVDYGENPT